MALRSQIRAHGPQLLLAALISLVVFAESCIPYIQAQRHTPAGQAFLGQVAYTTDQAMYFSFISQARDGAFVMNNKLTGIPNPPVFVNLEFWLTGFLQRVTGVSEHAVYGIWRYMGTLLLAIGFYLMAMQLLRSRRRVMAAVALFLFTGGLGFLFALLDHFHLATQRVVWNGIADMRFGLMPFQQIVANPHFSLPHGLILIAYACFIKGERSGELKYRLLSGLFFTIIGLVRPYDLIPPVIIFPAYVLLAQRPFQFDVKRLFVQFLPLMLAIPVFLYNLWLFRYNDIFKYWSLQGHNADSLPPAIVHYFDFGIIAILALIRVIQVRRHPLGRHGRFLLLWFGITFIFLHLGHYIPAIGWSPQIGVYLAAPLTLLACDIDLSFITGKLWRYAGIAMVAGMAAISNVAILTYFTRNFSDPKRSEAFYTSGDNMAAWEWMKDNIQPGEVVLASQASSLGIARYTRASVVAAHYSVTPRFEENMAAVKQVFSDTLPLAAQQAAIQQLNAGYIYIGPYELPMNRIHAAQAPYLAKVYGNASVTIYKVIGGK